MNASTISVRLNAGASSCISLPALRRATVTNSPLRAGRVPLSIPRSQAYYWTARWQVGEARALAQLGRGGYQEFENGLDAVRWLLSED